MTVKVDTDKRIRYIYELGKIHPLTYTYVMLMDDGFKLRFLKVKEEIPNELLSNHITKAGECK